ncbi:MAG: bestrophin family ion channel [Bacteroidota bacterium]
MQIKRRYSLWETIRWTRRDIFIFAAYGLAVSSLYVLLDLTFLSIPWLPISLIGIAVAFFLGFKTNSSYDRQWEARKIYGAIVNSSRSWAMQVLGFVTDQFAEISVSESEVHAVKKELIYRHIAWMTALRYQLRQPKTWEHTNKTDQVNRDWLGAAEYKTPIEEELKPHLSEADHQYVLSKKNRATHLLNLQSLQLKRLRRQGLIDDFRHMQMEEMLVDFFTQQGKCERIKNYPFPRQYATVNYFYIWVFIALLPFGLLNVFGPMGGVYPWLTIPFTTLIGWIFYTMERIGDYSENPFEGLHNDIPITALSRTIEIDLLEMLDEKETPAPIAAEHNFLM